MTLAHYKRWKTNLAHRSYLAAHAYDEDAPVYAQMVVLPLVKGHGMSHINTFAIIKTIVSRFVLADTEQLHRKISEMGQRIRQLEDALAIFQSGVSTDTHPLLRDELLSIKFGPEVRQADDPEPPLKDPLTESMDALGTLTIGDSGESKYFGRSAGSEVRHYPRVMHCI